MKKQQDFFHYHNMSLLRSVYHLFNSYFSKKSVQLITFVNFLLAWIKREVMYVPIVARWLLQKQKVIWRKRVRKLKLVHRISITCFCVFALVAFEYFPFYSLPGCSPCCLYQSAQPPSKHQSKNHKHIVLLFLHVQSTYFGGILLQLLWLQVMVSVTQLLLCYWLVQSNGHMD